MTGSRKKTSRTMGSIDQYLELYNTCRDRICAASAPPLDALREEAASALRNMRLPRRGDENYANIDLEEILAPDYGLKIDAPDLRVTPSAAGSIPDGVEIGSLRDFARRFPERVGARYGQIADMSNPITALDSLLVQDGLYLHVAKDVKLTQPLQLVNLLENKDPEMAVRRVLVDIEEGAECRLLVCDHSHRDDVRLLEIETVEIYVGQHARFDYYHIEESTISTSRLSALYARQEAFSQLNIDGITLYNGRTRNEYHCEFAGKEAALRLYGMGIEDGDRHLSTYSRIDHKVPCCKSDELFKYSVDDRASGEFTGRIHVAPGAVRTEAYQSNRNLVGSDKAKMYSRPQLEIYNDDVKCSHGCAIGQLDTMQLFYMRTRGLPEAEAKLLLRQAFMQDVIAAIDAPAIRDRLRILTERRFAGLASKCDACSVSD